MMKRFSCAGAFGTKTGSGLPSQEVLERNDASTKVVRLREAGYRTGTKRSFASLNGNLMRRQES